MKAVLLEQPRVLSSCSPEGTRLEKPGNTVSKVTVLGAEGFKWLERAWLSCNICPIVSGADLCSQKSTLWYVNPTLNFLQAHPL